MSAEEKVKARTLSRPAAPQAEDQAPRLKPIVLKYKKLKKKKQQADSQSGQPKYSRGLKDLQLLEGNVIRLTNKAVKAVSKGMEVYDRERQQSAREKTDGAIEDFIHNSAKATSAYLREASDLPIDLVETVSDLSYRDQLRKNLRRASRFIRTWRI
jgi:hypothetical protein